GRSCWSASSGCWRSGRVWRRPSRRRGSILCAGAGDPVLPRGPRVRRVPRTHARAAPAGGAVPARDGALLAVLGVLLLAGFVLTWLLPERPLRETIAAAAGAAPPYSRIPS